MLPSCSPLYQAWCNLMVLERFSNRQHIAQHPPPVQIFGSEIWYFGWSLVLVDAPLVKVKRVADKICNSSNQEKPRNIESSMVINHPVYLSWVFLTAEHIHIKGAMMEFLLGGKTTKSPQGNAYFINDIPWNNIAILVIYIMLLVSTLVRRFNLHVLSGWVKPTFSMVKRPCLMVHYGQIHSFFHG